MDIKKVKRAREEAKRFIVFCELYGEESKKFGSGSVYDSPKEAGLVRAQSIILTRFLAEMRKY